MERDVLVAASRLALVDAGVALVAYAALAGYAGGTWNPLTSSLSRLGVEPGIGVLFNSGIALASVGLALYAYCSILWLLAAAALSQVAVYTLAHPIQHFAAAATFFTMVVAELLRSGDRVEAAAALSGYAAVASGLLLRIPRGIALPEALVVASALLHLHRRAYCGSYRGRRV